MLFPKVNIVLTTIVIWMELPLFPLPEVVLFPNSLIPLHIFENRYREMVIDIMDKPEEERLVIIATQTSRRTKTEYDDSKFFKIGTVGRIVHHEELPDGKSNILVVGAYSGIVKEIPFDTLVTPYRQAKLKIKEENWNIFNEMEVNDKLLSALKNFGNNYRYQIPDLSDRPLRELLPQLCFGLPLAIKEKTDLLKRFKMTKRLELLFKILEHKPTLLKFKAFNSDTRKLN